MTYAQETANTILHQLGGWNMLRSFFGACNCMYAETLNGDVSLRFDFKGSKRYNTVHIIYNAGTDDYTMDIMQKTVYQGAMETKNEKRFKNIYCDQLQSILSDTTGLCTSL